MHHHFKKSILRIGMLCAAVCVGTLMSCNDKKGADLENNGSVENQWG